MKVDKRIKQLWEVTIQDKFGSTTIIRVEEYNHEQAGKTAMLIYLSELPYSVYEPRVTKITSIKEYDK